MRILRLSSALPKCELTTEEMMEDFSCELPEGVKQNVLNLGVSSRSLVNPVSLKAESESLLSETGLVDLCVDACEKAIEHAGISVRKTGYFIAVYDVSPFLSPGLGQLLVRRIGFNPYVKLVNVQGIASTAFPKALQLAGDHFAAHPDDSVLVCVSGVSSYWFQSQVRGMRDVMEIDRINRIGDEGRRGSELRKWIATMEYFLFGDGVAAAVLGDGEGGVEVKGTVEVTNVGRGDYLAGYSRLSSRPEPFTFGFHSHLGKEIPSLGVKYTDLALRRLLGGRVESTIRASKKWAVHTGSLKILDALAEHHGVDAGKLRESRDVLREHGNLSGASLPFILERIISSGALSRGDVALMVGYGWGFSAAASLLEA